MVLPQRAAPLVRETPAPYESTRRPQSAGRSVPRARSACGQSTAGGGIGGRRAEADEGIHGAHEENATGAVAGAGGRVSVPRGLSVAWDDRPAYSLPVSQLW